MKSAKKPVSQVDEPLGSTISGFFELSFAQIHIDKKSHNSLRQKTQNLMEDAKKSTTQCFYVYFQK